MGKWSGKCILLATRKTVFPAGSCFLVPMNFLIGVWIFYVRMNAGVINRRSFSCWNVSCRMLDEINIIFTFASVVGG